MIDGIHIIIVGIISFVALIILMVYFGAKKKDNKKAFISLLISALVLILTFTIANKIDAAKEKETAKRIEVISKEKPYMTTNQISYYTDESIRHFLNVSNYQDDTWDQKDALNASIKRTEWVQKELDEKFIDDEAKASIQLLAMDVNEISTKMLNKEYETGEEVFEASKKVGEQIGDITHTYLDGKFPPSAITLTK